MKLSNSEIKELLSLLGFAPQDGDKDIYFKIYPKHDDYIVRINFDNEKIEYSNKIHLGDHTTSNFENSENFVVLECVDRLLMKGYPPDKIFLEYKWPMGRKEKGKLDILIKDCDDKTYLMIECKTWGDEYEKEKRKMLKDGGQLFSYYQQDKATQFLCLYSSRINKKLIEYKQGIIPINAKWKELNNQKEVFLHWNQNFKDNGIFDEWANVYCIEIRPLRREQLTPLTVDDSSKIYNKFAEILRHNVISDKPNAFNKIFNLFLCKIVDENKSDTEALDFQWLDSDTDENLLKRLNDLYKTGMQNFLMKDITDVSDKELDDSLFGFENEESKLKIKNYFTQIRLYKNNEFAFKEVFNEKSFKENACVVREVVELLQPYQIRYTHKQQFLGDFFELLLNTGLKQETGQYFTPVPIAKFIVSSIPLNEMIIANIKNGQINFLPYVIDFAAGSGHFLTEVMDEIQSIIENLKLNNLRPSVREDIDVWKIKPFKWANEYIYGIEADYRLVKTAKVSCFLNGDGMANVIHADGLDNFEYSNDYKGKLKVFSADPKENSQFDILIANPPYSVSAFKNTLKHGNKSFELYDKITDNSSEIECLFIERAKQLLKTGGKAGIILPSTILNSTGIYSNARELIIKYFKIKAIVEFGSNTFMATNSNTIVLFLERRDNQDCKKAWQQIENFFSNPKDINVLNIENVISKYVDSTFENIKIEDYISFAQMTPNNQIMEEELFKDYHDWFNTLTEIKVLKEKSIFKNKTAESRENQLKMLFFEKVISIEKEKLLYFILSYNQEVIIVKTGTGKVEKSIIGYEFSNRRGHEGIKLFKDGAGRISTKLFNNDNKLDPRKINSYIYSSFLNLPIHIDPTLKEHITVNTLDNMLDYSKTEFQKIIKTVEKKSLTLGNQYIYARLKDVCEFTNGIWEGNAPPFSKVGVIRNTEFDNNGFLDLKNVTYINIESKHFVAKQLNYNDILLEKSGGSPTQPIGRVAIFKGEANKYTFSNFTTRIRPININLLLAEYLWIILDYFYRIGGTISMQNGVRLLNLETKSYRNIKIPLPPIDVQNEIIAEILELENNKGLQLNKFKNITELNKVMFTKKEQILKKYLE